MRPENGGGIMTTPTKQQVLAIFESVRAIADLVKLLSPVPSGELYARVMGHMSLESYDKVIGTLKRAELVSESGHLLTWVGPTDGCTCRADRVGSSIHAPDCPMTNK
jgi:hypothetical protein